MSHYLVYKMSYAVSYWLLLGFQFSIYYHYEKEKGVFLCVVVVNLFIHLIDLSSSLHSLLIDLQYVVLFL